MLLLSLACQYPRDPEGTLDRVAGGVMRVGFVEHPPWVEKENETLAAGIEPELLRQFAAELDSDLRVYWGSEEDLFTALEHFELDVVAGGLTEATPWLIHSSYRKASGEHTKVRSGSNGSALDSIHPSSS